MQTECIVWAHEYEYVSVCVYERRIVRSSSGSEIGYSKREIIAEG